MLPINQSLNLVFVKAAPLTHEIRAAILNREPGGIVDYELGAPMESGDAEVEEALSSILLTHSGFVRVVLVGFAFDEPIPIRLLLILGSRPIRSVERLEIEDGLISFHSHRPLEEKKSRTLLVFPGPIIPVTMGSHRRAFQLVANLAAQGCPVDLLITGGSEAIVNGAKPLLYQISGRISYYKNSRPLMPKRLRWRKRFERYIRVLKGTLRPPPDLFEERLSVAASFSGCKALRKLLEGGHYRSVIINYAWMANIRKLLLPAELLGTSWICDTHDVQFIRNETDNHKESRFFRCATREKQCEIDVLNSFDKVLAISEPDAESLKTELGPEKVIFTPTGFDYALGEPRTPDQNAPVFGFIGRLMRANIKALEEIIFKWWPAIHRRWPEATFHIAGGICKAEILSSGQPLPTGIVLDHMVADLSSWYNSIDVMLNPVMVQGGMNFKSMEAIMAAKLLLTNKMGSGCVSNRDFAILAETGAEAVTILEATLSDTRSYLEDRRRIRDAAREIFGDAHANQELLDYLRSSADCLSPRPRITRPQRILIQCGDHLENRVRVTALAQGIRAHGHHPVVLVYKEEFVAPFAARGIDAVAIDQFGGGKIEMFEQISRSRKIATLAGDYKGYNLDDISGMLQMQKPTSFLPASRQKTLQQLLRNIDRCAAMLEHVAPDQIIIWNGHTGLVANILRHHARKHSMPKFMLERSIFPDGVFVDPLGTNGNSELSRLDASDLESYDADPASRSITPFQASSGATPPHPLRSSGPWKDAKKIVFIPMQVQSDTNILLYSPHYRSMASFVSGIHRTYHAPGVVFIVRPHPEEVAPDLLLPDLPDVYVDSGSNLDEWIDASDLVVTINSTVGMQALLRGKRVRAFGHGLYTGKGFTNENLPSQQQIRKFWDILVDSYTSTPDHPLPRCLKLALPQLEPKNYQPKNHLNLDPDACLRSAEIFRNRLREATLKSGILWVVVGNLAGVGKVDLDYRRFDADFSEARLTDQLRKELDLPKTVEIHCVKEYSDGDPSVSIQRPDLPNRTTAFDKYGWIVTLPETSHPA